MAADWSLDLWVGKLAPHKLAGCRLANLKSADWSLALGVGK